MSKLKKPKKRAKQYDPKLKIEGSFEDVIGVSVGASPKTMTYKEIGDLLIQNNKALKSVMKKMKKGDDCKAELDVILAEGDRLRALVGDKLKNDL